jgi:hypothetical protein
LVPAALLASGLVVAAAATVLTATDPPAPTSVQSCADGREWVTVQPLSLTNGWRPAAAPPAGASLAGCVDISQLPEQSQQSDPRG